MKCLVSSTAALCYLIPHLPPPGVSAPPPCPGAMPSFSSMCIAAAVQSRRQGGDCTDGATNLASLFQTCIFPSLRTLCFDTILFKHHQCFN